MDYITAEQYAQAWQDFKAGKLTEQEWQEFAAHVLYQVMLENLDVFARLKLR